ncbi:transcription termination factor Rho, partial [Amycolatopsis mediterranei]
MSFHGILDLSGKTPFARPGYRPAPDDVAVPLSLVRKHNLRPGDEITGTAEKITSVNGRDPQEPRPCFADLVPVHPDRRLL